MNTHVRRPLEVEERDPVLAQTRRACPHGVNTNNDVKPWMVLNVSLIKPRLGQQVLVQKGTS